MPTSEGMSAAVAPLVPRTPGSRFRQLVDADGVACRGRVVRTGGQGSRAAGHGSRERLGDDGKRRDVGHRHSRRPCNHRRREGRHHLREVDCRRLRMVEAKQDAQRLVAGRPERVRQPLRSEEDAARLEREGDGCSSLVEEDHVSRPAEAPAELTGVVVPVHLARGVRTDLEHRQRQTRQRRELGGSGEPHAGTRCKFDGRRGAEPVEQGFSRGGGRCRRRGRIHGRWGRLREPRLGPRRSCRQQRPYPSGRSGAGEQPATRHAPCPIGSRARAVGFRASRGRREQRHRFLLVRNAGTPNAMSIAAGVGRAFGSR